MRGVAAVLVLSVLANPCQAASGDLDPTFGTGGVVRTSIDGNVKFARAAVLQPDGKVVVGGLNGTSTGGSPIFVFVRYRSDGTLDPTFGVSGVVQLSRFWADSADRASSLVLQPDGKIVAAGSTEQGDLAFALARLLPDGTLDSTFGAGGRVTTQVTLGSSSDAIDALNLDPDGSLVAAGYASAAVGAADFALARYRTDGTLDPTFGQGGIVKTAIDFRNDSAHALVRQPDGRYVVAGHAFTGTYADFALARYEADGRLDPTFGVGGIVVTTVGPKSDFAFTLRCQPDGKLLAGGSSYVNDFNEHFVVARYASDGSLDPTFGVGGIVSLSVSATNDRVNDLLLLSDGRILAAGYSFLPAARFALMRLQVDGTLDTSFGAGGIVTTPTTGQAEAMMRMPDGRIILAGTARITAPSWRRDTTAAPAETERSSRARSATPATSSGRAIAARRPAGSSRPGRHASTRVSSARSTAAMRPAAACTMLRRRPSARRPPPRAARASFSRPALRAGPVRGTCGARDRRCPSRSLAILRAARTFASASTPRGALVSSISRCVRRRR